MATVSSSYMMLTYLHLATIVPAFLIGTFLLLNPKGTTWHRFLGKAYMVLMLLTAIITLLMPAIVGPQFLHHFGFIHLFSVLVIWTVPVAYLAARRGDIKTHRWNMLSIYIGGLLIAGGFAFMPGRLLHQWLF